MLICTVDGGAAVEEQLNEARPALRAGNVERRRVCSLGPFDIGAAVEAQPRRTNVPIHAGEMQRSPAVIVWRVNLRPSSSA